MGNVKLPESWVPVRKESPWTAYTSTSSTSVAQGMGRGHKEKGGKHQTGQDNIGNVFHVKNINQVSVRTYCWWAHHDSLMFGIFKPAVSRRFI